MEKPLDLRIQKTYLALHNAFTELLAERRFEDFTVNELCDRAMLRRTTFYKHFEDKYDYYAFYLKEICDSFKAQLPTDMLNCDIATYCTHMNREILRFIKQNNQLVQHIKDSNMFPILLKYLLNLTTTEVLYTLRHTEKYLQTEETRLEAMASFFSGGLLNSLFYFVQKGELPEEEEFIEFLKPFMVFD